MNSPLTPRNYLPNPQDSTLLVIDIQERLAAAMPEDVLPGVLRNVRILAETAQEFVMPVILSEQYRKGLGPTLSAVLESLPEGTEPVEKIAFSCCAEPAIARALAGLNRRSIIMCGMETHVCVLQTGLDLLEQGYKVYVAADAICSRVSSNWQIGIDNLRQAGAVVGSTEMFVFGLLGAAGSERFKRISRLVK